MRISDVGFNIFPCFREVHLPLYVDVNGEFLRVGDMSLLLGEEQVSEDEDEEE